MAAVRPPRRTNVDWLRGLAVLCMIEWHVLDAWTRTDARAIGAWPAIALVGGFAAPLFLFLAGVAVPLAIASHISRGATPQQASWLVQKRGWQVFGLAMLFRLQSFIINPYATWSDVLTPDILNVLGLGLVFTAWLAGRGRTLAADALLLLGATLTAVVLAAWTPSWWWPSLLHPRIAAYIRPTPGDSVFTLFPWTALVFAGGLVGVFLAHARDAAADRRTHFGFGVAGVAVAAAAIALAPSIAPPSVSTWAGVWTWTMVRVGFMTLAIAVLWWPAQRFGSVAAMRPLLVLGQTSLFVYWVHVELAYGFLSLPLHRALPLGAAVAGVIGMVALMYFAGKWWMARTTAPWIPERLRADGRRTR